MSFGEAHLRTILATAVQDGVLPGAVVLAGAGGQTRVCEVAGRAAIELSSPAVHRHTVWDLASLTKPLVTGLLVMQATAAGAIALDEPIGATPAAATPADVSAMTVRLALAHAAGFAAHLPFWADVLGPGGAGAADPAARVAVTAAAGKTPLAYRPGTRSIYSDLGFIRVGDLLERRLGDRLDRLATTHLGPPFGTPGLHFRPIGASHPAVDLAATEVDAFRGRLLCGEVHDPNAYAMGGVAGHAGLFGHADAVADVVHTLLAAYRGAATRVHPEILRQFWRPAGIPNSTWRLGWDGPSARNSIAGDRIARTAVGHLAFTGCSLWIDPERDSFVLMLSNAVNPPRDPRINQLRRAANDAALDAIGYVI
jgi:CubicO group peptidase (beta-lactamase class C family)